MRLKQSLFWSLLIAFGVACTVWFFYVPYRPENLYRLVPENTVYLSHHDRLAERWEDMVDNPLAQTLLQSAGITRQDLDTWRTDESTRHWLDRLLARDVVILHVPALGPGRDPAWVAASWIGGKSIRLRWWLTRGSVEGLNVVTGHAGGTYAYLPVDETADTYLSMAILEGLLVGVWSRDPHAVRHIVNIYDGTSRRHPQAIPFNEMPAPDAVEDRGWFIGPHWESTERARYHFGFRQFHAKGLSGMATVRAEPVLGGDWPTGQHDLEPIAQLLGGLPFTVLGSAQGTIFEWTENRLSPSGDAIAIGLQNLIPRDAPLLLATLGGAFTGTYRGIAVPAVLACWPVPDEAEALQHLQLLLDRWNAYFQWGLVAPRRTVAGRDIHIIESTGKTTYARLSSREQMAFTVVDHWMVVSSSSRALERLLERLELPESIFEADDGGWQVPLRTQAATAHFHLDLAGGARTLHLALSAWAYALLMDDAVGSRPLRAHIAEARAWLSALEPLGSIHLQIHAGQSPWTLDFEIGKELPDAE